MRFGLRPHRRGQWCRIVAQTQIGRDAQVEDDRGRSPGPGGRGGGWPNEIAAAIEQHERARKRGASSGTVCNAAGQLLRSGRGIETPGTGAAVVVRQREIAASNTRLEPRTREFFSILWKFTRAANPGYKGPECRRFSDPRVSAGCKLPPSRLRFRHSCRFRSRCRRRARGLSAIAASASFEGCRPVAMISACWSLLPAVAGGDERAVAVVEIEQPDRRGIQRSRNRLTKVPARARSPRCLPPLCCSRR